MNSVLCAQERFSEMEMSSSVINNPIVLIKTELGDIKVEVYEDKAPITATNFLRYVDNKLYDGTTFFGL